MSFQKVPQLVSSLTGENEMEPIQMFQLQKKQEVLQRNGAALKSVRIISNTNRFLRLQHKGLYQNHLEK